MAKPRALILIGYGINCDNETELAFSDAGAQAERVHVNEISKGTLRDYQIFALPGGFSFGDDPSAGKILAIKLESIGDELREFLSADKLLIGICNGAQALIKLGVVPATDGIKQTATLTNNDSGKFEDRWVYLKGEDNSLFTKGIKKIYLPVRHGEGKFICDDETLKRLKQSGQIALRYAKEDGTQAEGTYPENPNGSLYDIAGITDPTGKVFILMPHPEAYTSPYQHPHWTRLPKLPEEGDGMKIFRNAVEYFK